MSHTPPSTDGGERRGAVAGDEELSGLSSVTSAYLPLVGTTPSPKPQAPLFNFPCPSVSVSTHPISYLLVGNRSHVLRLKHDFPEDALTGMVAYKLRQTMEERTVSLPKRADDTTKKPCVYKTPASFPDMMRKPPFRTAPRRKQKRRPKLKTETVSSPPASSTFSCFPPPVPLLRRPNAATTHPRNSP